MSDGVVKLEENCDVKLIDDNSGVPNVPGAEAAEAAEAVEEPRDQKDIVAARVPGIVKWFNVKRGYGFISRIDTKEDIFMHRSAIARFNPYKRVRSVGDGEFVVFDVVRAERGFEAANITGPDGEAVRGSQFAANTINRTIRRQSTRSFVQEEPKGGAVSNHEPEKKKESEVSTVHDESPNRPNRRHERGEYVARERCIINWREHVAPNSDSEPEVYGRGTGVIRGGMAIRGRGPPRRHIASTVGDDFPSSSRLFSPNFLCDERGRGGRGRIGRGRSIGRGRNYSNVGADFAGSDGGNDSDPQFEERGRGRASRRGRGGMRDHGGGWAVARSESTYPADAPEHNNNANRGTTVRGAETMGRGARGRGDAGFNNVRPITGMCTLTNTASSSKA